MKSNGEYDWSFASTGGTTRVNISSGEDIMHLDELDQKLWTVLSCPVKNLEMDARTLSILDADSDGHIHVNDIIRTSRWLRRVINDPDCLLRGDSYIPLSAFNRNTEEGDALYSSARHILNTLGLDQEYISTENVSDPKAIYKSKPFNGDGVVTCISTEDEGLRQIIRDVISTVGPVKDRSGEDGVDAASAEKFFTALKDYAAWREAGEAGRADIFPYGDSTEDAYMKCLAVRDKMEDWFMRCSVAAFDSSSTAALDTSAGKISAVCDRNLAECADEIASCPLAKVNPAGVLSLKSGINPIWKNAVKAFTEAVSYEGDTMNEPQWRAILGGFAPYVAWKASRKGEAVEPLGYERIRTVIGDSSREKLAALIARDLEFSTESENITKVSDLLFIYRDFFKVLNNFITFKDFYSSDRERMSVFQAGTLYIDQRCCRLCIKVADMGAHAGMAPLSEMFLLYCECTSRDKAEKMTIAAAVTDGSVDNLRVGKNGIFYDRSGMDWEATVVKVIDNPISIREAFWTPYRKLGDFVGESISKFASQKESDVIDKGMAGIGDATKKIGENQTQSQQRQPFDVAKFAGLFAMIGMALGTILGFFLDLFKGFAKLTPLQMVIVILGLILVISGPSMLKAWMKLRKRNITPLLNANGWAINSKMLVNVNFGRTLTSLARYPMVVAPDEFSRKKKVPWYLTAVTVLIVILGIAIAVILFRTKDGGRNAPAPEATEQAADAEGLS